MSESTAGYLAVVQGVGFIDRSDRVRLEIHGSDRVKFLHNLTTNDVKRLPIGTGCEAFVTSPQGKTLGYVTLLACEDRILLRSDPGALEQFLPHLQKYGVFDDVTLLDARERSYEFHLAGPRVEDVLRVREVELPPEGDLAHIVARHEGHSVRVIREAPTGRPGLTFLGAWGDAESIARFLHVDADGLKVADLDAATIEALRIEAGTPVFGRDVTPENLPQEVGRDSRAINFVKGCYLGQETVARLDALGHVNKILKGLIIQGREVPPAGTELEGNGKKVGAITSAAFSLGWGAPLALGYVRVQHSRPRTELRVLLPEGPVTAVVADLPMLPPNPAVGTTNVGRK